MRDLRLFGFEDGIVVFESLEGEKYRVLADESLRSALRQAMQPKPSDLTITPREIQDRVRSGESVSDIAAATGASEDFVEKFAQPVLDELEHIVNSALAIRITIAGDRFNDDVQEEFGHLIAGRLTANGAAEISWSSKRGESGTWDLTASYSINGHPAVATWSYEPRKNHLSPETESAVALSNHNSVLDGPISKLRTVATKTPDAKPSQTGMASNVTEVISTQKPNSGESAPAAFRKVDESPRAEPTASNLLDELKKRRESTASVVEPIGEPSDESIDHFDDFDPAPTTGPLMVVPDLSDEIDLEPEIGSDVVEAEPEIEEPTLQPADDVVDEEPAASVVPKKGRAAMPSWDEIVFGTKTDDEI